MERLLPGYVVGVLAPWSRMAVVRHLDGCPGCRGLLESHHQVAILLDRLPAEEPPVGLWNGVLNEISGEVPGRKHVSRVDWNWRPGLAVAALGVTAGIVIGQWFNSSLPNETSTPAAMTAAASPAAATFVHEQSEIASRDPLSDPVSLGVVMMSSFRETERLDRTGPGH